MFRSEHAGLLRPKRIFLALGWLLLALAPIFAVSAFFTSGATMLPAFHALVFGTMSLSYGVRSTKGTRVDSGTLAVTDDAITLGGRVLMRRGDVKQAFVVPRAGRPLVRVERRGRFQPPLFFEVGDRMEADAFVRALGLDAEHTAAEMRIASTMVTWSVGKQLLATLVPVVVLLPSIFLLHRGPLILAASYIAYTLGLALAPTTVRVGTDGIVTRWLGRTRFIAHSEIVSVASYDEVIVTKRQRGVKLELRSGEVVRLPTGQQGIAAEEAAQLERRIDEAREAHARGATAGTTDVLARGDRPLGEWTATCAGSAPARSACVRPRSRPRSSCAWSRTRRRRRSNAPRRPWPRWHRGATT